MQRISRRVVLALLMIAASGLAGCSDAATGLPADTIGLVRFVNGSPDAGNVDVSIGGQLIAQNIPYAGSAPQAARFSAYTEITALLQPVSITQTGTATAVPLSATSAHQAQVFADQRVTLVLAGSVARGTLELVSIVEPLFATPSGLSAVTYHQVSPATTAFVTPGYFLAVAPNGLINYNQELTYKGAPYTAGPPTQISLAGIGYAMTPAGATPAMILPSSIDPVNTQNVMPLANNADQNLSLYLIDGSTATAPVIVGTFDSNG